MGNPQLKLNEVVIREELVRFCDESADAVADDAAIAASGAETSDSEVDINEDDSSESDEDLGGLLEELDDDLE
jgi:hypothetical protein